MSKLSGLYAFLLLICLLVVPSGSAAADSTSFVPPNVTAESTDGTVSLVSTRTTNGTWTITGLTIGKPLIITIGRNISSTTYVLFNPISGVLDGVSNRFYCFNSDQAMPVGFSTQAIPISTTVRISVQNLQGTLRAYQ